MRKFGTSTCDRRMRKSHEIQTTPFNDHCLSWASWCVKILRTVKYRIGANCELPQASTQSTILLLWLSVCQFRGDQISSLTAATTHHHIVQISKCESNCGASSGIKCSLSTWDVATLYSVKSQSQGNVFFGNQEKQDGYNYFVRYTQVNASLYRRQPAYVSINITCECLS